MESSIALDLEPTPDGSVYIVRALLKIAGEVPEGASRVPLNLSIVLDRSGSMSGEKLEQAKNAAALLVSRLWPEDVVSVVAYDDDVRTIAEPATGGEQAGLSGRIRAVASGGMTNLSGGWLRGRELVAERKSDTAANRVLLLTDGLANVGITDPDLLVGLCRGAVSQGITTSTIGFGEGFDEELLRRMAEAGGGSTYYIEHPDQAPAVFGAEIEGLLALSAQNVTVELRPAAAAKGVVVHHRYPSQSIDGGTRYELGDLYARDPRLLMVEFVILSADPTAEVDVAELVVTAHVISAAAGVERREIRLPIRASLGGGARVDPEVRKELLLLEAARAREEARDAQRRGDYEGARQRLDGARCLLADSPEPDEDMLEEAEDLRQMSELFRLRTVGEADAKYLSQRSVARTTNRKGSADAISRVRGRR